MQPLKKKMGPPMPPPPPPPPIFINLPFIQQGGKILSQSHGLQRNGTFFANQTYKAHTGIQYVERFTELAKPSGATTAGTADDTNGAVSAFTQELVTEVIAHGGNATEFSVPGSGNGGDHALVLRGVIEKELYQASGNHVSFALTYATPDGFVFNQQVTLKASRVGPPQPGSSFTLLQAVDEFDQHFQVTT